MLVKTNNRYSGNMSLQIIAAVARDGIIGSNNDLPWYLPADLRHFKEVTMGHTVVMGRKTFESILQRLGKPLPDRKNVVITRDRLFSYPGVTIIHDVADISKLGDCFVIGGAEIYRQTIDMADRLYITEVHADIEGDTFFPDINSSWKEISREQHQADDKNQYDYDFVVYERF